MNGLPSLTTAAAEFVVPRSMPMIRPFFAAGGRGAGAASSTTVASAGPPAPGASVGRGSGGGAGRREGGGAGGTAGGGRGGGGCGAPRARGGGGGRRWRGRWLPARVHRFLADRFRGRRGKGGIPVGRSGLCGRRRGDRRRRCWRWGRGRPWRRCDLRGASRSGCGRGDRRPLHG